MKYSFENIVKPGICLLFFGVSFCRVHAQHGDSTTMTLSLNEAIQYAKGSNKLIGVLKTEEKATQVDVEDAKLGAFPRVFSNASYQRYTNVTLYKDVLGDSHTIPKPPNANAGGVNIEAAFNLYAGGRQRYAVTDVKHKNELACINTKEQEANIALQVALQYLDMIRVYFQERLIKDQIARAETRVKNINAFYANGKVTKSDLLRADVGLSNVLLSERANRNDYLISNQRLNTFLNLNEFTKIIPLDTASLSLPDSLELESLLPHYSGTYVLLKAQKNIELQENRVALARTANLPTISLFGGYGFNYPNTLVFPPQAQTVAVGLVGVKLTYDISSLYQNKNKVRSASMRADELKQQKDWLQDNVQQEVKALQVKYYEAVERMLVVKKTIEQTETNYNIQNTKYTNQLSLLTDLLDADNLYQESRYNYIQANIAALSIYYRILFITGKL
ncbi:MULTISPECIES: TolC family protein [Niastella]|uniref:TolC family protein n=1 Tax=Niastella soli TaxID=2821487 RepID=A0ABS3YLB6_9BACT|nr:TolC family protein [Niastella soli]MBO9198674.1 TolC family protein [Niastella soli]